MSINLSNTVNKSGIQNNSSLAIKSILSQKYPLNSHRVSRNLDQVRNITSSNPSYTGINLEDIYPNKDSIPKIQKHNHKQLDQLNDAKQICITKARIYGRCITSNMDSLSFHQCEKEFLDYKNCITSTRRLLKK